MKHELYWITPELLHCILFTNDNWISVPKLFETEPTEREIKSCYGIAKSLTS